MMPFWRARSRHAVTPNEHRRAFETESADPTFTPPFMPVRERLERAYQRGYDEGYRAGIAAGTLRAWAWGLWK